MLNHIINIIKNTELRVEIERTPLFFKKILKILVGVIKIFDLLIALNLRVLILVFMFFTIVICIYNIVFH